jgi:hypothetical protein
MAPARKGRGLKRPRFPRKLWLPGQAPRTEKPKKGGGYDRPREKRRTRGDVEDLPDTTSGDT